MWKGKGLKRAQREFILLKEMLVGEMVSYTIKAENRKALPENIDDYIRDFKTRGLISGWVPLLTPEGKKYLDALEEMYGGQENVVP